MNVKNKTEILSKVTGNTSSLRFKIKRYFKKLFLNQLHHNIQNIEDYDALIKRSYNNFTKKLTFDFYYYSLSQFEDFDHFYKLLGDKESRDVFDWYVMHCTANAFLNTHVAAILYPPRITKKQMELFIKDIVKKNGFCKIEGFVLNIPSSSLALNFLVEQYKYKDIIPKDDDVVFDVGAFEGDSAFYFLTKLNENGRIYAFEPFEESYNTLKRNIQHNNVKNIIPVKLAFDSSKGEKSIGGSSGVATLSDQGQTKIMADTIDNYVQDNKIQKVDFIKMDIEGSELNALKGGEKTIKSYAPDLAICVYHKGDDLITIPKFIKQCREDYKFYLRNNSTSVLETVLYATVRNEI